MSAPVYEIAFGELCGDGCARPFSYVAARVRAYCKKQMVQVTGGERRVLDRLISEYPTGKFWTTRNGTLLSSVCRDAARFVSRLDNWTDDELSTVDYNSPKEKRP